MLKKGFLLILSLFFSIQLQASTGFRQVILQKLNGEKLNVVIWYPTRSKSITKNVGDNAAFVGVPVILDAPPTLVKHPVLVISHGYMGNWRNLSWIAEAMAEQGYIVAAPDHLGTTTFNQDPNDAKNLWQRPRDISQVIDFIFRSSYLFGSPDKNRVAALGHSLGGWTVMSLAGATFDPQLFVKNCQRHLHRGDCLLIKKLGLDHGESHSFENSIDRRIKSVVSLDAGLVPGFTPQSLRNIDIPVLILAAQNDSLAQLPSSQESEYISEYMSPQKRKFKVIQHATHFSFMQLCKIGAEELINKGSPGEGIVCHDGPGASRIDIHNRLIRIISLYLNSSLNYHVFVDETK